MKTEKVIFLDIDGVLNSEEGYQWSKDNDKDEVWHMMPYKKHLEQLQRVIDETNSVVVISSTWRIGCSMPMIWRYLFAALGFKIPVISVTPRLRGGDDNSVPRGIEIQSWIDERNFEASKEFAKNWNLFPVGRFAIIDDDSDMGELIPHLFKTKWETGLTKEIADKVIEYLNTED